MTGHLADMPRIWSGSASIFALDDFRIVVQTLAMTIIRMRSRGQLTLPDAVRRAAHLEEGDVLVADVESEQIVLRPKKLVDASQAWFWTAGWQQGEREASAEIAAGETTKYDSDEDFLRSLE